MFRVSTLDLANLPRTPEGKVDFAQDFFGREAFLTVSGQLNVEACCLRADQGLHLRADLPCRELEHQPPPRRVLGERDLRLDHPADNAALAEALLKYTFAALLNEGQEDLAFFDQRIEKGLVAKLKGIVGSEFVHMDYDEAIGVLERANEKFEFPVQWGVDLQSEHERYLTEKYAKRPVIVMNYPKAIKAFYMRLNDDGCTVAAMDVCAPGIARPSAAVGARSNSKYGPSAASTASTTPSTPTCAATARCRTPASASASASSATSPTSPASPTSATPSLSRERLGTRGIERAQVRSSSSTSSAAAIFFSVPTVPLRSPFSICDK